MNFSNSNFTNGNFTSVGFSSSNLTGANFTGATIMDLATSMTSAYTYKNSADQEMTVSTSEWLDLRGQTLTNVNFANAKMAGVNLSTATLNNCNFSAVDLTGAVIDGAKFQNGTTLTGATLRNLNNVSNVNFANINLSYVTLTATTISSSIFDGSNLTGAKILIGNLNNSSFQNVNLNSSAGWIVTNASVNAAGTVVGSTPLATLFQPSSTSVVTVPMSVGYACQHLSGNQFHTQTTVTTYNAFWNLPIYIPCNLATEAGSSASACSQAIAVGQVAVNTSYSNARCKP